MVKSFFGKTRKRAKEVTMSLGLENKKVLGIVCGYILIPVVLLFLCVIMLFNMTSISTKNNELKMVKTPARLEVKQETFVVVSVQDDIPGFQKVILHRTTLRGEQDSHYFAGLAAQDHKFKPGQGVEVVWVRYLHSFVTEDDFFLVRPKP